MAAIHTIKLESVEEATSSQNNKSTMEINNHLDTTVLILNFLPLHDFDISLDVSGWDASAGSFQCLNISGIIAYDHPNSGKVYMMVYYEVIHCPRLANRLMCLMQSGMAGFRINELSKFLVDDI